MGMITETLNKLGYGENLGKDDNENVRLGFYSNKTPSNNEHTKAPKIQLNTGLCTGCELSARYY